VRLPKFQYLEPRELEEALEMRALYGAQSALLAGGTDLLVRMKQRLMKPSFLISLKNLRELSGIRIQGKEMLIGAGTPLKEVAGSALVNLHFPALAEAARAVGAYTIQQVRGTIGGNLCQDTRCLFYNQSAFWRSGRQACHKAGGKICYAREGSDRCRSTNQSDGATALMALQARVTLRNSQGLRDLSLEELFTMKGETPLDLAPNEILTQIRLPMDRPGGASAYERIAYRSAIDFPVASAGVWLESEGGTISKARIAVGCMGNAPLLILQAGESLEGRPLEDTQALAKAARIAMDQASAFAVENVGATVEYRVEMVSVLVERALRRASARAAEEKRGEGS